MISHREALCDYVLATICKIIEAYQQKQMPKRQQSTRRQDKGDSAQLQMSGTPCGLTRRMAAILYDGLLLFALLMLAALIIVLLLRDAVHTNNVFFQLYLLVVAWAYFALCWRGGQSLGMKAWRIHIVGQSSTISWTETAIRFLVSLLSWAALGLGFIWSWFHPQRAAWHDLASRTRLIVVPPAKSTSRKAKSAKAVKAGAEKPD